VKKKIHRYYIGIGSNIYPQTNLPTSVEMLSHYITIKGVSTAWQTAAVGSNGPDYLNAAVEAKTKYTPHYLKNHIIRGIETRLGRVRSNDKNTPRTIDLDILIYDDQLLDVEIWKYAYLAVPLSEILPDAINPINGETLEEAAERLSINTRIIPRPEILSGVSLMLNLTLADKNLDNKS
jgi:2-amino-4-hydroxy-6-hydroxymethyldihydropteridine diphosphokinase